MTSGEAAPALVLVEEVLDEHGLSSSEAARLLAKYGRNEVVEHRRHSLAAQLLRRLASPLVAILVVASIISGALGDLSDAAIVMAIVLVSIVVELFQTERSQHAAEALRAHVAQTAMVLRDDAWREVPRAEVVPGDLVQLSAGDLVPADASVVTANDVHVNEAAMTGESLPVEKHVGEHVLLGSSVVSGTATARVVATGRATEFGGIAEVLQRRRPASEFEHGVARFGLFILQVVVFMVLFVFVVSAARHHGTLESLMFAVALAVGLTPEFLPMIATVTLTRGAVQMAHAHVIVKDLAAIQNFGSMDILCSDKTGTLTTGEMKVEEYVDSQNQTSERPLLLAYINSYFESGVENPVDAALRRHGKLDPIDAAVLRHEHPDISGFRKVDEIPFDFERRRVSVVAARGETALLISKGAPESLLAVCTHVEAGDARLALDDEARRRIDALHDAMCRRGLRVVAVASRRVSPRGTYTKLDEHDLVFSGFLGLADPVRDDAREVVDQLRRDGVEIKVLTGDSPTVARHICAKVGIATDELLTGTEIASMSDPALAQRVERTTIFARVAPAQKTRIMLALKTRGHVVGFLGDGINDAPSLHSADIGISVSSATDVAREAAEIVLLEPGLRALGNGVRAGRAAFGNIMKYLLMGTSSNFGNMFSMAGAAAFLPFLPMLPKQVLLNNFLYDLAQITIPTDRVDEALVQKPRRWDISLIRKFMIWVGPVSSLYDFLTFYVMLKVFEAGPALFHTGWFVESLATQTAVIFVIRTSGNPLRSRPSRPLVATTLAAITVACLLPFTPFAHWLGFVPLPPAYFAFLGGAVLTYLALVEVVKRLLFRATARSPRRGSRPR
ncbi:MAG: magnesium-translocating P-type ATPase [Kofleriaceae bacterium]|nr:magnesium-translocating P-type ATPase [Kofleriaceae bacterium]